MACAHVSQCVCIMLLFVTGKFAPTQYLSVVTRRFQGKGYIVWKSVHFALFNYDLISVQTRNRPNRCIAKKNSNVYLIFSRYNKLNKIDFFRRFLCGISMSNLFCFVVALNRNIIVKLYKSN